MPQPEVPPDDWEDVITEDPNAELPESDKREQMLPS